MVRAWHGHGMASINQTRPHCVNQMEKTHSKPLARHDRGTAWARHAICESTLSLTVLMLVLAFQRYIYQPLCCNQNFKSSCFILCRRHHNSLGRRALFLKPKSSVRDVSKRLNHLLTRLTVTASLLPSTFSIFRSSFIRSLR